MLFIIEQYEDTKQLAEFKLNGVLHLQSHVRMSKSRHSCIPGQLSSDYIGTI